MQTKRLYIADLLMENLNKKEITAEIRKITAARLLEIRREKKNVSRAVSRISQLRGRPIKRVGVILGVAIDGVKNV